MGTFSLIFNSGEGKPVPGDIQGRRPVEQVNWYNALVFCNKLSIAEGFIPAYRLFNSTNPNDWGTVPASNNTAWNTVEIVANSTGYRLPTEAQWEYACRAGTASAYNTGAVVSNDTGWYSANSSVKTHEVGKKPANAWGLYDMHGNVSEWCWDWYGSYSDSAENDPFGPNTGTQHIIRNASWGNGAGYMRSAFRTVFHDHGMPASTIGIRLVRP